MSPGNINWFARIPPFEPTTPLDESTDHLYELDKLIRTYPCLPSAFREQALDLCARATDGVFQTLFEPEDYDG